MAHQLLRFVALGAAAVLAGACARGATRQKGAPPMSLTITSPAFTDHGSIPPRFTCEGDDVSPPLAWSGVPKGTRSLALVVDDPDAPDPAAPTTDWVHWVLFDIPPDAAALPENAGRREHGSAAPVGREGTNDWKRTGWGGPCPPVGTHRYFFRLYALDTLLPDLARPSRAQLERAMQGHVLARGELVGVYRKRGARR